MKFFITFLYVLIFSSSQAQQPVLYGGTFTSLTRYDVETNDLKTVFRLKNSGIFNKSYLVAGKDGIIYGVAEGGPHGHGIIFSLDPTTIKYTIRKNFTDIDGISPNSALVQAKDGKLYGILPTGGQNNRGAIFSFDPVSSVYRIVFHFDDVNASNPGVLTAASDGLLYGVLGAGQLYAFNPITREYNSLVSSLLFFSGPLIEGAGGILYAMDQVALYSYAIASKQLTKLVNFNPSTGVSPEGRIIMGSDGKLYFVTASGGMNGYGTIACYDPTDNSIKAIYDFDDVNGTEHLGGFSEGEDGKLYGMRLKRDPHDYRTYLGSIFYSIDKNGNNFKVLRDFDHHSGNVEFVEQVPFMGNMIRVNNKVYGIALAERTNPYEYIFSYESSQDLFQQIVRTNLDKGTWLPGFIQGRDGLFYGMAGLGGVFGRGYISSFNPGTNKYTMLYPFHSIEREPSVADGLVQADNGKLYGLTAFDGFGNRGLIFSYDPDKWRYVIEKTFDHVSWPTAPFALGKDGILYSVINLDASGENYMLSFNPKTREYKQLAKLCCGDVYAGFTALSDGKLYAASGGIYIYDPAKNLVEYVPNPDQEHDLSGVRLVEGPDHKLYGITDNYIHQKGFIFSFDPADRSFTILLSFNDYPYIAYHGFTYASDGKIYGTTRNGGMYNKGIIFSYDPSTHNFSVLRDLEESLGGFLELDKTTPPVLSITNIKKFEGERADLTVSLNRISTEEIALNYSTVAGTATGGGAHPDFVPASGQLVIPPGEISTNISVSLLQDDLIETREEFTVVLQKANEALFQFGDSVGRIHIKNGLYNTPPGGDIITIAPETGNAAETGLTDGILIRATPNPSSNFFTLNIGGKATDHVSVIVTNVAGQIMNKFDGALKNSQLVFGQNYRSGSYFVRVVDGKESKVIKLIKTSK